jgi:hypothetical protein
VSYTYPGHIKTQDTNFLKKPSETPLEVDRRLPKQGVLTCSTLEGKFPYPVMIAVKHDFSLELNDYSK